MALTYLADTSVLTRLRRRPVRAVVEPMLAASLLARAAISDLEIGLSASNADQWDGLAAALGMFGFIEVGPAEFRRASQVQRLLAAAGLEGRKVPDLLVAAAAEAAALTVLHYDVDFDHIAAVTGQPVEWVVPAGSVP